MKRLTIILLSAAIAASCGRGASTRPSVTIDGFALGTVYSVTVVGTPPDSLREKVEAIFERADESMSIFNGQSLLSRLNRNETDITDEHIARNIATARKVSELSGGRYDITVLPLVEAYGFGAEEGHDTDVDSLLRFVGYDKIEVRDGRLIKSDPRVRMDLNSVAKGYIVDMTARMLEDEGVADYLVNIGGEIFCRGANPRGNPWRIAIDTPAEGNMIQGASTSATIAVTGRGVATSGNYRNYRIGPDGRRYTHIIDPTTGAATTGDLLSATVVADECAMADALGTMFMALGMEGSMRLLESRPDLAALLIYDTGDGMRVYVSPAMEAYRVRE